MEPNQSLIFGKPLIIYVWIAGIAGIAVLLRFVLAIIARRLEKSSIAPGTSHGLAVLARVIRRLMIPSVYLGGVLAAGAVLRIGDTAQMVVNDVVLGLIIFFAVRLVTSIMGLYASRIAAKHDTPEHQRRLKPIIGFLKGLVWLLAFLVYLDNLGIQVSSIMAGLGIGGIAVALAAQSILGDLFSYFIIFFDRPFEIGDYIQFEDLSGTIEQVGMKTTKLRALSGEQIVVSNSALTGSRIKNFKRMERRRVAFSVFVRYGTSRDLLESIPDMIRAAVEGRELTQFDRCHLKSVGSSGLEFETVYLVKTADYASFMDTQQSILLKILEDFGGRGIALAYPSSTVYLETKEPEVPEGEFMP